MMTVSLKKSGKTLKKIALLSPLFIAILFDRYRILRGAGIEPMFFPAVLYYFTVFRPDILSVLMVFSLGIFDDALSGALLGQNTLEFLLMYGLTLYQRQYIYSSTFYTSWITFGIILVMVSSFEFLLASLLQQTLLNPIELMGQTFLTTILYPLFASALNLLRFKRVLPV